LYLASASPRRRALLEQIGLAPQLRPACVDESPLPGEAARDLVLRLAESKAREAASRLGGAAPGVVLAADTVVLLEGSVLGKPADRADARSMLLKLRGRTHEVLTGVFLSRTDDGRSAAGIETTRVRFREYEVAAIDDYVASGEGLGKAGGYAIQGRGALLVERIEGSWSNVVGLPLERLPEWLKSLGLDLRDLPGRPADGPPGGLQAPVNSE
jgi:septum formation protein